MADDEDGPKFIPGTCVSVPAMVSDSNGVIWWVNPGRHTCERVRVSNPLDNLSDEEIKAMLGAMRAQLERGYP